MHAFAGGFASFQDPDLQELWIRSFAEGERVLDIAPEGAAPVLLLERHRPGFWRELASPTNQQLPTYTLPGDVLERELGEVLRRARRRFGFDVAVFDLVPAGSRTLKGLEALRKEGWWVESRPWQRSPVVHLEGTPESYWRSLSHGFRSSLTNAGNRLQRCGLVEFGDASGAVDWRHWIDAALELESKGWKGDLGTAINQRPALREFYRGALRRFHAAGQLRLFVLKLDGNLIAFNLVVTFKERCVCWKTSYDPDHARFSPGNLLMRRVIDALRAEPRLRIFDLMYPPSEWKMRWATGTEERLRVRVYPNALIGCTLAGARAVARRVRALAQR